MVKMVLFLFASLIAIVNKKIKEESNRYEKDEVLSLDNELQDIINPVPFQGLATSIHFVHGLMAS